MERVKSNTNLSLYYDTKFRSLPLMIKSSPFIYEYLEKSYKTIHKALDQYPRVFAFRVDLHFPVNTVLPDNQYNYYIQKFIDSLNAKLISNRIKKERINGRAHGTVLRYIWARERKNSINPHYHFAIILNYQAYRKLGQINSEYENLYSRIRDAWVSSLGITWAASSGLVHIPDKPEYYIVRGKNMHTQLSRFFYRISYLCKVRSKVFGEGYHVFGSSRD